MLGAFLLALGLSTLLSHAYTFLAAIAVWFIIRKAALRPVAVWFFIRKTAPCLVAVNAAFEVNQELQDRHHMLIGSGGRAAVGVGVSECPVCTRSASKKCSRCKSVWYCCFANVVLQCLACNGHLLPFYWRRTIIEHA